MSYLVIEPYLIELVRKMEAEGFSLIVAGGLGLYLKRRWVEQQTLEQGRINLFEAIPQPRPTTDIDVFLSMDVFLAPPDRGVTRFRQALASLDYEVHAPNFQFTKTVGGRLIKLDLHVRLPCEAEPGVKYDPPRVRRRQRSQPSLHAFGTPEAFAIEERTRQIPLIGNAPDGQPFVGTVVLPHPFSALCMKIQAALDHERTPPEQREPVNQKHAFDVYLLLSMLDHHEVNELTTMVQTFADRPEFVAIQTGVAEIFESPTAPGCRTIEVQTRNLGEDPVDLTRFSALLRQFFAIP